MTASERRQAILARLGGGELLKREQLAEEYHVSERTIRHDVEALMCDYPVVTVKGRNGGIKLAGWFHPSRKTLSKQQIEAVRKAADFLDGEDRQALISIITQFSVL